MFDCILTYSKNNRTFPNKQYFALMLFFKNCLLLPLDYTKHYGNLLMYYTQKS